jgi:predicted RNase H-related nuclease YkuK (DUF458 family)
MEKNFKNINGQRIDIVKHTMEILNKYPNVKIHIGTDSLNKKRNTRYSTVIVYRYGTRGAHYIYTSYKIPRINDKWTKLWKEVEFTIEICEWLKGKINVNIEIDMDYNSDELHFSNKLINSAKGWANSLGYKVNIKPYDLATKAADHIVNKNI